MRKTILITLITLFSFSNLYADFLLASKNKCIIDYYYKSSKLYYHYSTSPDTLSSTSSKKYQLYIFPGFDFNSTSKECTPPAIPQKLGIQYHEYKFLMALLGLLLGSSFLFALLRIFSRKS